MSLFDGKAIAITGAASGMGLATAQLLASRGTIISLADINKTALKEKTASQAKHITEKQHIHTIINVRDSRSVDEWIQTTVQSLGRLDGAVNMAGIIKHATSIVESTDEDWASTMAVNARGVYACLRAQLKAMSAGGSIVSAASVFGTVWCPRKCWILRKKSSSDLSDENRSIRTPLSEGESPEDVKRNLQHTAQKRRVKLIEIARVIAFLLIDECSFVTGAIYNVDGGWVC
ncbi:hypothetical protein AB5N19_07373 [Seiridium cardinale]